MAQPVISLVSKVYDFNLDEVELSAEQMDNLTATELKSNDWRYVVITTDASSVIKPEVREKIKHQVCSQFSGIVELVKLDTKYHGKHIYECVSFYYPKSDKMPSGTTFTLG